MSLLLLTGIPVVLLIAHLFTRGHRVLYIAGNVLYGLLLCMVSAAAMLSPLHFDGGIPFILGPLVVAPSLYLTALNAPIVFMCGIVLPMTALLLRSHLPEKKSFYVSSWIFTLGVIGAFISNSLLLFYVFFELSLIGAYFWIGLFGRVIPVAGKPNERAVSDAMPALTRFFLFTLVGSLSMLVSVAFLYSSGKDLRWGDLPLTLKLLQPETRKLVFLGFILAFAVKLPLFGLHGWLRDAYRAAPPGARVLLSAVMSKLGAYGLLMIAIYFRAELLDYRTPLMILCTAGVIYAAVVCLAQRSLLDALIYVSLSHLNALALGIVSLRGIESDNVTISAVVLQIVNHGLIMGAVLIYDARLGGPTDGFSGLRKSSPRLAALLLLSIFSAISLPGLSSFPGEILILVSAFRIGFWYALAAGVGLLIAAAAIVRIFHRIFLGKESGIAIASSLGELTALETTLGLVPVLIWLVLGLAPSILLLPVQLAVSSLGL